MASAEVAEAGGRRVIADVTMQMDAAHVSRDVIPADRNPQPNRAGQKGHHRKFSRKTSESFNNEASPRTNANNVVLPVENPRRRSRPEGIRNMIHRRQQQQAAAALRRSSESALLPPIKVSSIRQLDPSLSQEDVTENCSPTSIHTLPLENLGEEDIIEPLPRSSTQLAPLIDRGEVLRSPLLHHQQQRESGGEENGGGDSPRFTSPIPTPDLLRLKAEQRISKSVADTLNDVSAPKSPTVPPAVEGTGPAFFHSKTSIKPPTTSVKPGIHRKVTIQALPKLSPNEEPFSIRRKIEQFRKWHEEQYAEKLHKLKVEADREKKEAAAKAAISSNNNNHNTNAKPPPPLPTNNAATTAPAQAQQGAGGSLVEIDFAKMLEENMKDFKKPGTAEKTPRNKENLTKNPASVGLDTKEKTSVAAKKPRCKSGASWRTWRDVNDSYAYDNVTKYIEDNELLPPDRVQWINQWIGEVEKAMNGETEVEELEDMDQG